jgi:probable rRNA maturation factor
MHAAAQSPRAEPLRIRVAWRLRKAHFGGTTVAAVRKLLRRVATQTTHAEGFTSGYLSVAVVGTRAMTTLHRRYRGTEELTDVLAFDLGCDLRLGLLDAEIVLCADLARRVAAARWHDLAPRRVISKRGTGTLFAARAELALYLVHGILHLAGYEDDTPTAARRIHAREDELLTQLGLGPVFRQGT